MKRRTAEEWQRWVEEFSQGENAEAWRGIMCFLRWIQIRAENGHAIPNFLPALEGDLYHSLLLRRMLSGREPLNNPPPESNQGPWYELIETGRGFADEVKPWEWAIDTKIAINQGIWTILEKKSDTEFIVAYRQNSEKFRLSKQEDGRWLLEKMT